MSKRPNRNNRKKASRKSLMGHLSPEDYSPQTQSKLPACEGEIMPSSSRLDKSSDLYLKTDDEIGISPRNPSADTIEIPDNLVSRFAQRNELRFHLFKYCLRYGLNYWDVKYAIDGVRR